MLKRALILALWFYAGWTFGGLLTYMYNVPELVGPVMGLVAAVAVHSVPRLHLTRSAQGTGGTQPVA